MSAGLEPSDSRGWTRYFFSRRQAIKTTWTLRLGVVVIGALLVVLTRPWWVPAVGRSLICEGQRGQAQVILIENFDPNYLLFEHVATMRSQGASGRVVVPVQAAPDPGEPNLVSAEIVKVMARVAQIPTPEVIPIREIEPMALTAARQVRDVLQKEQVSSVVVVTDAFRSRRSSLVYQSVFGQAGIATGCVPVFGTQTVDNWADTWHGVQRVGEEFLKLQYYRWYVFPFLSHGIEG
jgi:hypothetical protein